MHKTVFITGGNTGIGLALVQQFLKAKYTVIATSRSGSIPEMQSDLLTVLQLDITSEDSIQHCVLELQQKKCLIDLLINNAGVGLDLEKDQPDIKSIRATFDTNVFGLIELTESILPFMVKGSTIFCISSIMGMMNRDRLLPNATAYRMSKAALNMYVRTLAARLQKENIRVNSIHPGWVKTRMGGEEADLTPEFSALGIYNLYQKSIPTGTFWAAETLEQMSW